jgi:hypothetical protein
MIQQRDRAIALLTYFGLKSTAKEYDFFSPTSKAKF